MTDVTNWLKAAWVPIALIAAAIAIFALVTVVSGASCQRGCTPDERPIEQGIDAAPGELVIADRLDAEVQTGNARLAEIRERYRREEEQARVEHETALAALRTERETVLDGGPEAVAAWLDAWYRQQRDGGLSRSCDESARWCRQYGERSATCTDARRRCRTSMDDGR